MSSAVVNENPNKQSENNGVPVDNPETKTSENNSNPVDDTNKKSANDKGIEETIKANIITSVVRILEKHIEYSKQNIQSPSKINVLKTVIEIINAHLNKSNANSNLVKPENLLKTVIEIINAHRNKSNANSNEETTTNVPNASKGKMSNFGFGNMFNFGSMFDFGIEGRLRRSNIKFDGTVLAPDSDKSNTDGASPNPDRASPNPDGASPNPDGASPSASLTKKDIYSAEIIPEYQEKPGTISTFPDSFVTKLTINGILDRSSEIAALHKSISERKKEIDDLTEQVKSATESLTA
jgi:hypothetical protein